MFMIERFFVERVVKYKTYNIGGVCMSKEVSNSQILQAITELSGQVQNLSGQYQYQNLSDQVRLERLFFYSKRASFLCGKINLGSGGASHLCYRNN